MWNTSAAYKTEIKKKSISYTWFGTITLSDSTVLNFTKENIDQNKSKITRQYVDGETLEIGNAFSHELILGLRDAGGLIVSAHHYEFYDAVIRLTFRLYGDNLPDTEEGTGKKCEDVPCGVFTVHDAEFTYNTVKLTAYDAMYKAADTMIMTKLSNGNAFNGLTTLCTKIGVTMATTQAQIEAMPNGTRSWNLNSYKKDTAVKDIIEDICACLCANAIIDRQGNLVVKPYSTTSVGTIGDSNRYSSSYVDYIGQYTKIVLENKNGEEEEYDATHPYAGYRHMTINIGKNPLLNAKSAVVRDEAATDIIDALCPVLYAPLDITMPSDPSIDIGDSITGVSTHINGSFMFIDTKDEMPLFGQMKITSAGGNYELANRRNATKAEKAQSDVNQQLINIGDNITIIQMQLSELSGFMNVGYILPIATDTENIADGSSREVLTFEFTTEEVELEEESEEEYGEAISFYSELCFYIDTTVATGDIFGDGILSVTYNMDGVDVATSAYTYGDGWKILTLNGFFPSLEPGEHRFIVKLSMSGGAITTPT